jgi:hypothetical protein
MRRKTQGNPLAAGVIAFGLGMLVSSLIPSTEKEREVVSQLQENLEPVKEKASEVANDIGDSLKPAAQEAAESVKTTAQESVESVKQEGQSAADVRAKRASGDGGNSRLTPSQRWIHFVRDPLLLRTMLPAFRQPSCGYGAACRVSAQAQTSTACH